LLQISSTDDSREAINIDCCYINDCKKVKAHTNKCGFICGAEKSVMRFVILRIDLKCIGIYVY